jgi:hypothetical protein
MRGRPLRRGAGIPVAVALVVAGVGLSGAPGGAAPGGAAPAGTAPAAAPVPAPGAGVVTVTGNDDPSVLPWRPPQAKGGVEDYPIRLSGDVGTGNLSLAGGLRADEMCFWRPAVDVLGSIPDSTLRRIAARRGVAVPDADALHTLENLVGAPEYEWDPAVWAPGGMAEQLYGTRVAWPSVTDLMLPWQPGVAQSWPTLTCAPGRSTTPSPAYWAAVEAEWPGARTADALFLRPGLLAAVAYQFVRINRAPPRLLHSPRAASVARLATWFWLDPTAYRPVQVTAAYQGDESTVVATPRLAVTFSGGPEDGVLNCADTGQPYRLGEDSDCSRTFRVQARYRVTARVVYDVVWMRNGEVKEVLPTETSQAAVSDLPVDEVQVLVGDNRAGTQGG